VSGGVDRGEEGDGFKLDELMASGAQLLGRITYEASSSATCPPRDRCERARVERYSSPTWRRIETESE
jgi:hypothetical protein